MTCCLRMFSSQHKYNQTRLFSCLLSPPCQPCEPLSLLCVTDGPCLLASATVASRHSEANTLCAEALGALVSVAATVSHLLGLPASSSVIMPIYRPTPLVPDVFVLHFCYDEAQMSHITRIWLLNPPLWLKEKRTQNTWVFDVT